MGRGQPLGIGTTGHPFFNKLGDTENPSVYLEGGEDDRMDVSFDPKQIQLLIVGCVPSVGSIGKRPSLVLMLSLIQGIVTLLS